MTDKELQLILSRMANSDVNALAEVYREMKIPIFTIIYRIVGNKAEAEDVMQEFFVRLYKNAQNITVKKPRAYIFQMARNMALDNLRWQKRAGEPTKEEGAYNPWGAESDKLDIESAMTHASESAKEIITLHINAGLKFREISEITKTPLGTVIWKYRKGISQLQKYFNGDNNE